MMRSLLVRGMIAGLLGGLVAFGIAKIVGEPQVDTAIAFEEYVARGTRPRPTPGTATARTERSSSPGPSRTSPGSGRAR